MKARVLERGWYSLLARAAMLAASAALLWASASDVVSIGQADGPSTQRIKVIEEPAERRAALVRLIERSVAEASNSESNSDTADSVEGDGNSVNR